MRPHSPIDRALGTGTVKWICVVLTLGGCAARHSPFDAPNQPPGCRVEAVAVDPGRDQFSFRGVSPDGRRLAVGFSGGSDSAVGSFLLDVTSGARMPLTGLNNGGSFSPDGNHLVVAVHRGGRHWDIVERDLQTGATREIASDSAADFLPSYSPDGAFIVFNSYRTGHSDIYLYERATATLTRLTTFDGYDAHAQFSPTGRTIVFHREVTRGNYDLVLLDLASQTERLLTTEATEQSFPAFSPDGRFVVYSDDREEPGKVALFVYSMADGSVRPLGTGGAIETYAHWSRDGRYIYFNSRRSGRTGVYRVRMDGSRCVDSR